MRKRENPISVDRSESDDDDPRFVKALARGLDVLRAFRRGDPPLNNQELARRTGLPKPTISRLTYTLSRLGYLEYSQDTGRYRLSLAALALGFSALGSFAVRDVARPHMQRLAEETGVSVALGAPDDTRMVYVEHCRGGHALQIGVEIGTHIRMATSSMGRAYLASLPVGDREPLMARLEHDEPDWPDVRVGIDKATAEYAEYGYVLSLGDWKTGVNAVGVPVVLGGGSLSFALNCGGPSDVLTEEVLRQSVGPKLVHIASMIQRDMLGAR